MGGLLVLIAAIYRFASDVDQDRETSIERGTLL